ncbi:MAG: hypothetical protein E6J91_41575 [Deltaproteobacteria bacterium]|nr:MAG: hypothetical protein E6J91_41575 [Deltaproteobacteria bacterium]
MTMTLGGRLQTRLVLLSSIGLLWTIAISAVLPRPWDVPVHAAFRITLASSVVMTILGFFWELVYHALQQLRWDKDWPPLFGLLTAIVEVVPVWWSVRALNVLPNGCALLFAIHFTTTWILIWLITLGPISIVQPRWRFEGGEFSRRPGDALVTFVVSNTGMVIALVLLWAIW